MMKMTMIILKMPITNPDGKSELSEPGHAGGEADQVESTLFSHRDLAVLKRVYGEIVKIKTRDNNNLTLSCNQENPFCFCQALSYSLLSLFRILATIKSHIFYCL